MSWLGNGDGPGHWAERPGHPSEDWKYEVANGDTRLGYREWARAREESESENPAARV